MSTKKKDLEKMAAHLKLREYLKPGDTVYTILRHVSRSGMMRVIDPIVMVDGTPVSVASQASVVLGYPLDRDRWGVKATGCGTDMGFNVVYNLSYTMFKDGFGCTGEGCPSNDHSNGDRDYTPHVFTPHNDGALNHGHWHKDGGYALKHRWI